MININIPDARPRPGETIPRIIHYCWFGKKPLPYLSRKCLKSWKRYLPDYHVIRWDENTFDVGSHPYTKEAYSAQKWAFVTDYVRLYALYHYGGIYMDTDIEVVKPLDRFLRHPAFTSFEPPNYINPELFMIQTGLIGAGKGNVWIRKMLDYYENKRFFSENGEPDLTPNPIPLTAITVKEFGLKKNDLIEQVLDNAVVVYAHEYLSPMDWKTRKIIKTKNTYAIHHFMGSWHSVEKISVFTTLRKRAGFLLKKAIGNNLYDRVANTSWRRFKKMK